MFCPLKNDTRAAIAGLILPTSATLWFESLLHPKKCISNETITEPHEFVLFVHSVTKRYDPVFERSQNDLGQCMARQLASQTPNRNDQETCAFCRTPRSKIAMAWRIVDPAFDP